MLAITLFIQQILNFSIPAAAAPVYGWRPSLGNRTALLQHSALSWVPEPRHRGTWGILWSCTLTLILYNPPQHLNVPAQNEGRFSYRYYLRGFKWALVALIVPEALLLFAGLQWYEAKTLCEELKNLHAVARNPTPQTTPQTEQPLHTNLPNSSEPPSSEHISCPPEWRFPLEYGFYAGMGGFQIDTNQLSISYQAPSGIKGRTALTACGVVALGRAGVFIPLDRCTIRYKSQVDVITKVLTIFQVTWMVIEASVRMASGMPLSLLEIHSLVHAFCALIMYLFWFKKPVGVRDPTLVFADKVNGTILFGEDNAANRIEFRHSEPPACGCYIERTHSELSVSCRHAGANISHFLTTRPSNARDTAYVFEEQWAAGLFAATFVVFAAYAAVHLTTWNFRFPTHAEEYVWRASCITILTGSLPAPVWLILVDAVTDNSYHPHDSLGNAIHHCKRWHDWLVSRCFDFSNIFPCLVAWVLYAYFLFSIIFVPLFLCARMVIIIESFISLRKVPEGVYVAVPWTEYIPHI